MNKKLIIKREDGQVIQVSFKKLDLSYLDKIMELQEIILDGLENKELYAPTDREEFAEYINNDGVIMGLLSPEDEIIAMGVYVAKGYDKGNYGYDLNLEGEELLKVGQIESTVVKKEFRGNKLQRILCEELEAIARENNNTIISSTASPYNKFSVNTFLNLGYEIKVEKEKYGGLKRYVFMKIIS